MIKTSITLRMVAMNTTIGIVTIAQDGGGDAPPVDPGNLPAGPVNQGAGQGQAQQGDGQPLQPGDPNAPLNPNAPGDSGGNGGGPGGLGSLFPILIIVFVVMWIFMISGQRREKKKKQQMINSITKGTKIQTVGGVMGTVVEVRDEELIVKVDENTNTRMRFARSAVNTVLSDGSD